MRNGTHPHRAFTRLSLRFDQWRAGEGENFPVIKIADIRGAHGKKWQRR